MVLDSAVSSLTTGQSAGVNTLVILAGSLRSTVRVLVTLPGNTPRVRVPVVAGQTLTDRAASDILTLSSAATDSLNTGVGSAA